MAGTNDQTLPENPTFGIAEINDMEAEAAEASPQITAKGNPAPASENPTASELRLEASEGDARLRQEIAEMKLAQIAAEHRAEIAELRRENAKLKLAGAAKSEPGGSSGSSDDYKRKAAEWDKLHTSQSGIAPVTRLGALTTGHTQPTLTGPSVFHWLTTRFTKPWYRIPKWPHQLLMWVDISFSNSSTTIQILKPEPLVGDSHLTFHSSTLGLEQYYHIPTSSSLM